ncbi:hypothetical protein Cha6605_5194 [Chamaesiphon minutus PCC 6605]|uniref:Uncharacterized protein n=1 Tax=Chamaesiphon minutus (strain ATCC 27169 / PCC 6605) TaxID=1173020 RepID=K9UN38_CHAP6|nr:hypothetical protein Cha6605_5194 [Chamaesiphon minutus PCC 6605]
MNYDPEILISLNPYLAMEIGVFIDNTNYLNYCYTSLPLPTSSYKGEEQILEIYLLLDFLDLV